MEQTDLGSAVNSAVQIDRRKGMICDCLPIAGALLV